MQGVGWFAAIFIGGIAGWIAERVMQSKMGIIANVLIGILGAVVLNGILRALDVLPPDGWIGQLLVGAIGAILLIWLWRVIRGRP